MARPKKQLNRKTEILEAAQVLFAEKGYEKTTIDEIAKHLGIGKGTVYLDFKNKEEILKGLIENLANSLCAKLEIEAKNAKPPYLKIIEKAIKNDIESVFDMVTSQMQTHISLIHTSYQMKKEFEPIIEKMHEISASLLEKAAKNGEIKTFDNYKYIVSLIKIALQGFFPPYDYKYSLDYDNNLSKEEIKTILLKDSSIIIEMILSGLKMLKCQENNK